MLRVDDTKGINTSKANSANNNFIIHTGSQTKLWFFSAAMLSFTVPSWSSHLKKRLPSEMYSMECPKFLGPANDPAFALQRS